MKILIIEDDELLSESVKMLLEKHGFQADQAFDGETGIEYALTGIYDLLILDVMLPKKDGYKVAHHIRSKHCGVPILMLTAKSQVEDRIAGLNSGADYYLAKPFNSQELLACMNALLRRQGSQVDEIIFGNTSLDLASAALICGENSIRLSAKEFEIMRMLFQSGRKNLSKEVILSKVWGFDSDAVENHVEVYVGFLRKKLKNIDSNIRIEAVRNLGYHLEADSHD